MYITPLPSPFVTNESRRWQGNNAGRKLHCLFLSAFAFFRNAATAAVSK
jgi:hypothetical protein